MGRVPVAVWGLLEGTEILAWVLARNYSEVFTAYAPPTDVSSGAAVNLLDDGVLIGVYGSLRGAQAATEAAIGL